MLHSQSRLTTTIGTRSAVADQSTSTQSLVAGTLRTGLAAHGLRTISQRILSATQQKRKAHTFLNTSATLLFSQQQTAMLIITQELVSTTGQQTFMGIDVVGMKVLGADGNVLFEAGSNKDKKEVQKKPVAEESSSGADSTPSGTDSKKDDSKKDDKSSAAATSSTVFVQHLQLLVITTTTATSSAAASDNTAATGATAGLALAGYAVICWCKCIVISQEKVSSWG